MPEDQNTNQEQANVRQEPIVQQISQQPVVEQPSEERKLGPGGMVLQWLAYAFWGWAALSLSWLIFLVMHTAFNRSDSSFFSFDGFVPYALAATIVLLIIALITDIFFKRIEPKNKQGASTVIMIIHAVIFALFAIGWLIVGVFGLVVLLIGTGGESNTGVLTQLSTSAIMVVVYAATLLRTLNPVKIPKLPILYWAFMGIVMAVTIVLAIIGPVAAQREALKDKPTEEAVRSTASSINRYANQNDRLPTLDDVKNDVSADTRKLIDEGRIAYTPKNEISNRTDSSFSTRTERTWRYELCGQFESDKSGGSDYDYSYSNNDYYDTTPQVESHGEGKVCYQLQTRILY